MKWFRCKPLTDVHRVLNILLAFLQVIFVIRMKYFTKNGNKIHPFSMPIFFKMVKSKFQWETKKILENKKYRSEFNWLQSKLDETAPSKQSLNEIFDILNANDDDSRDENARLATSSARYIDSTSANEDMAADTRAHCFTFTSAWETPLASDMNTLKLVNTSLQTDADRANHEHTLQYFDMIVNDYPGEYFLQSPYIFAVRKPCVARVCK